MFGIKNKIKSIIIKNELLYYTQRIVRGLFNRELRKSMLPKDSLEIVTLGKANKGKTLFIYNESHAAGRGFFATYRYMIEVCIMSDVCGFYPVFHYDDAYPYSQSGVEINGATDPFEQYFQQPCGITYEEAMHSIAVVVSSGNVWGGMKKYLYDEYGSSIVDYYYNEEMLKKYSLYSKKYIHLNPDLELILNKDINDLLGTKKTLAVHVRIKVFQKGIDRHPVVVSLSEYIDVAKKAMSEHNFEQIFLATEEINTIQKFQEEFGESVVFYSDVFRSEDGNVTFMENMRHNHKYRLGYEVIRDMHTLAICDGLIAGLSQVSFCAQITKYEKEKDYEFKHIFNLGVHHSEYTLENNYNDVKEKEKQRIC